MKTTTGISELDSVLDVICPGDNFVWRVNRIEVYRLFCERLTDAYTAENIPVHYYRFGTHAPLLPERPDVERHNIDTTQGFEQYITYIHQTINNAGDISVHIFDSLSDLSESCYSDRMIGNFFKLTCPYLRTLNTIAYFSMYRGQHSYHAKTAIFDTAQIIIDVYHYREQYYLQPAKVQEQPVPETYMLYRWQTDHLEAIRDSGQISDILAVSPWKGLPSAGYRLIGIWDKTFMRAEQISDMYARGDCSREKVQEIFSHILRLIISRDPKVLKLAEEYFDLPRLLTVWKRMIGTGMIGGKSVGMLLARAILHREDPAWDERLERHDSFYIGSDVFYTFLVENGCWSDRQRQKDPEYFLDGNDAVRKKILAGVFPDYILKRFSDMLRYFGRSPIIVRSSSLLEDNFGNAFAGKYESVFCVSQGTLEENLAAFLDAVKVIYASTMSAEALSYRRKRGVLDKDEQMALLVQRVSGAPYDRYFFPQLAGVGFSFNPYVWSKHIEPEAGMVRLVFGLGTRAVDRTDDDYTHITALNAPDKRPEGNFAERKHYTQRRTDILDLEKNEFSNAHYLDILKVADRLPIDLFADRDRQLERSLRERGRDGSASSRVLTFERLMRHTTFVPRMRSILQTIKKAYGCDIDIEFTANFDENGRQYKINIVQCRPLQIKAVEKTVTPPPEIPAASRLIESHGAIVGYSRTIPIRRLVYLVPREYGRLSDRDRYNAADVIDAVAHAPQTEGPLMLIGPGRWGTTTPSLGIPVRFSQINTASVLCEIDMMHDHLVPDLSIGTHFFHEMVEMNMLYIGHYAALDGNVLDEERILERSNLLSKILPDAAAWEGVIHVTDGSGADGSHLYLNADSFEQKSVLFTGDL